MTPPELSLADLQTLVMLLTQQIRHLAAQTAVLHDLVVSRGLCSDASYQQRLADALALYDSVLQEKLSEGLTLATELAQQKLLQGFQGKAQ